MSQGNLLPAFLAGFVAAAGLGAVIVPMLSLPLERELRVARDDYSAAQRQLAQEQALTAQLAALEKEVADPATQHAQNLPRARSSGRGHPARQGPTGMMRVAGRAKAAAAADV